MTLSAAPTANRVSVAAGVSETMRSGRCGLLTTLPSSSVNDLGNSALVAVGLGTAVAVCEADGVATWVAGADGDDGAIGVPVAPSRPPVPHAARLLTKITRANKNPLPNGDEGACRDEFMGAFPFSRRKSSTTMGPATGLPASMAGHRSGTVPDSHRLRGSQGLVLQLTARVYCAAEVRAHSEISAK